MLFTAGAADFISRVILQDETIRQSSSDGTPLVRILSQQDILPGIKVDTGAKPLAGAPAKPSPKGSTSCGIACPRTARSGLASRNGAR